MSDMFAVVGCGGALLPGRFEESYVVEEGVTKLSRS